MANGDDGVEPATETDEGGREEPGSVDPRRGHRHPLDEPEADVLEQELPASESDEGPTGLDAERVEPVDDDEHPVG